MIAREWRRVRVLAFYPGAASRLSATATRAVRPKKSNPRPLQKRHKRWTLWMIGEANDPLEEKEGGEYQTKSRIFSAASLQFERLRNTEFFWPSCKEYRAFTEKLNRISSRRIR